MYLAGVATGCFVSFAAYWIQSRRLQRYQDKRWEEVKALEHEAQTANIHRNRTRESLHNEGVSVMRKARLTKRRKV